MNGIVTGVCLVVGCVCTSIGFVYWMVMLYRGEANAGHFFPWREVKTPDRFPVETIFTVVGALALIVAIMGNLPN